MSDIVKDMAIEVARRFRILRKSKKVTIKALSEKSGVPNSTLRRFESKGEIGFLALVKLAKALEEEEEIRTLFLNRDPKNIEEFIRNYR